jgi:hypothetical protein
MSYKLGERERERGGRRERESEREGGEERERDSCNPTGVAH